MASEAYALYEYSKNEQPASSGFEERMREIRMQRLKEVMGKLASGKGVAG